MCSACLPNWPRAVCAIALLGLVTGCDRAIVSGRVLAVDGEPLPGVVVSVEDEPGLEALSNALGEYRLLPPRGAHPLRYSKSGYAPAAARVETVARESAEVEEVAMWRLPRSKGVFIYEGSRFVETTPAEPKTFLLEGGVAEYAIRGNAEARTENPNPTILCYHMPRYEARLTRLRTTMAQLKEGQDYTFEVLASAGTIPVRLVPVDLPEGLLMQALSDDALEPGTYALHWGALAGETVLEPRAHLFTIGGVVQPDVAADATGDAEVDEPTPEAPGEAPDVEATEETAPDAEVTDETEN